MPTTTASLSPSESQYPSFVPTADPSLSGRPSQAPSDDRSNTNHPSFSPVAIPPSRFECEARSVEFGFASNGDELSVGEVVKDDYFSLHRFLVTGYVSTNGTWEYSNPAVFDTGSRLERERDYSESEWELHPEWGNRNLRSPHRFCTGGDDSLGWGTGGAPGLAGENCQPLGKGLIIRSANTSIPDASYEQSVIRFDFRPPVDILLGISILNVDSGQDFFKVTIDPGSDSEDEEETVRLISVPNLGTNSAQTVPINEEKVTSIELHMTGPRVVTGLQYCSRDNLPQRKMAAKTEAKACPHSFGRENFEIENVTTDRVVFRVRHGFCPSVNNLVVGYQSDDDSRSCVNYARVRCLQDIVDEPMTASCEGGYATVRVAVASPRHFDPGGGGEMYSDCPSLMDEIGPACSWEVQLPCLPEPEPMQSAALSVVTTANNNSFQAIGCSQFNKAPPVLAVSVDQCSFSDTSSMVNVIAAADDMVTFSVSSDWVQCGQAQADGGWVAVDFLGLNSELQCLSTPRRRCGEVVQHTAMCENGSAVVDVYAYEASGVLNQTDGSALDRPPEPCGFPPSIDTRNMCRFRHVLPCAPRRCEKAKLRPSLQWLLKYRQQQSLLK